MVLLGRRASAFFHPLNAKKKTFPKMASVRVSARMDAQASRREKLTLRTKQLRSRCSTHDAIRTTRHDTTRRVDAVRAPTRDGTLRGGNTTDLEYVLAGMEAAPLLDGPFDSILYWCRVWPPDLYAAMERHFPPTSAMEAAKLSRNRNKAGFSAAVRRRLRLVRGLTGCLPSYRLSLCARSAPLTLF